jgi:hypothetical protein
VSTTTPSYSSWNAAQARNAASFAAASAVIAAAKRRSTDPRAVPATRKKLARPVAASVAFQIASAAIGGRRGAKPCQVPPRNAAAARLAKPAAQSRAGSDRGSWRLRARRPAAARAVRPSA